MKTASVADMQAHLSAYLKQSVERPVVVTQDGKPVAVLVAIEDEYDLERLLVSRSPQVQSVLERTREQIKQGSGIPHDEFWREFEEPPVETPKQRRQKKP